MLADHSPDPLISQICRRILADESRHMGFGMLSLPEQVIELSDREIAEAEDFACVATGRPAPGPISPGGVRSGRFQ